MLCPTHTPAVLTSLSNAAVCVIATPSSHDKFTYSIHSLDGIVHRTAKRAGEPPESPREVQAACRIVHVRCAKMALQTPLCDNIKHGCRHYRAGKYRGDSPIISYVVGSRSVVVVPVHITMNNSQHLVAQNLEVGDLPSTTSPDRRLALAVVVSSSGLS
jgi:hypothetical protein